MLINSNEFVKYIIEEIKINGILSGSYYSIEEIEKDIIETIENAHKQFIKEKGN